MKSRIAFSVLLGSALVALIALGTARTDAQTGTRRVAAEARQVKKEASNPPGERVSSAEDFLMLVYGDPPNRVAIVRTEDGDVKIPLSDFVLSSELLSPSLKAGSNTCLRAPLVWGIGDGQEGENADIGVGSLSPKQLIELLRDGQTSFEVSPMVIRALRLNTRADGAESAGQASDSQTDPQTEVEEAIEQDAGEIEADVPAQVPPTPPPGACKYTKVCPPPGGGTCTYVCGGSCGWLSGETCSEVLTTNPDGSTYTTCRCVRPPA